MTRAGCETWRVTPTQPRTPLRTLRRVLPSFTVRTWILATVLSLTALALVTAGFTASRLQELRVDARIDNDLLAEAEEFRLLADVGVDPDTGQEFDSPDDLVRTAMERVIPARHEGVLGFVDGQLEYTTRDPSLPLEEDPEFIAAVSGAVVDDRVTLSTVETSVTTYRVIAVPVTTAAAPATESPSPAAEDNDSGVLTGGPEESVAAMVLAYDRTAEQAEFGGIFVTYAGVAIGSFGVVGLVGWLVSGRLLGPVRVLAASARRIGREGLSERIPVRGNDDLSDMTRAVNEMLGRLDAAFASQRQLLDDVGHELRTPLTVIRGHLELMDAADPAEAAQVRSLVLNELDRMNRFVDDLMTLATADSPTFLKPTRVSLGELTDDVFDKVLALGGRQWRMTERAEAHAWADDQRLTQAWLQLAANAVKFSVDGSTIHVGSRVVGHEARLWVSDEGRGISAEDLERIFDRFGQVSPGDLPGAGLGLAIVSAIAHAHGGTVRCDSTVGEGSTFTMTIPLESSADPIPAEEGT